MNALAWTAIIVLSLGAFGALVLCLAWFNDRWQRRGAIEVTPAIAAARFRRALLVQTIVHVVAAGIVGLIAGVGLAWGYISDLPPWLQ
jgi:hypothetical protein